MTTASTAIGRRVDRGDVRPGMNPGEGINVADSERLLSLAVGGLMGVAGLTRGTLGGLFLAGLGGALVHRGLTGHCNAYQAFGINTAEGHSPAASVAAGHGVKVVEAVTINRPVEEVYRFWRNFENLPRVMHHLESVRVQGDRSHWVAIGPFGKRVEWDAEIINQKDNELIAWRSLEGSTVATAGSVHFRKAPADRGTEVLVNLKYDPPGGQLAANLAWLTGREPTLQVRQDLLRLKQLLEAGEIATTEGQPSGREPAPAPTAPPSRTTSGPSSTRSQPVRQEVGR